MIIRKANPATDQGARSLLQKAVRRANVEIVEAVLRYLCVEKNDGIWLRSRLAVMVFEEAWPYGMRVDFDREENNLRRQYVLLCQCSKNKDAAGLGSLAYALSQGDSGVLQHDDSDWYIRVIAKAIIARAEFWNWIDAEASDASNEARRLVERAQAGSKKAGWPWDKAFAYAAALLAIRQPIPPVTSVPVQRASEFPYWVALDKHTAEGKQVLRAIAKEKKLPANVVLWLSFYMESGLSTGLFESPWWERERQWRCRKLGLSLSEATNIWNGVRPIVAERLQDKAAKLANSIKPYFDSHVSENTLAPGQGFQSSLFDSGNRWP